MRCRVGGGNPEGYRGKGSIHTAGSAEVYARGAVSDTASAHPVIANDVLYIRD